MKLLVTGGSGFIGSHVVDELVNRGHDVTSFDRNRPKHVNDKCLYVQCDVTNPHRTLEAMKALKPELTIHLAGILGTGETWDHVNETVDSNISGAVNVYEGCKIVRSDILTVDVGSRWLSPYTISKRCGAEYGYAYGNRYKLKAGALRAFNVYGPRQGTVIVKIIPKFIEKALRDETLQVFGDKAADLIHVRDVARAFAQAVEHMDDIDQREDILIGGGEPMKVREVADAVVKLIGRGRIEVGATRPGEERAEAGYMSEETANKLLDWEPKIRFSEGLPETVEWYLKNVFTELDPKNGNGHRTRARARRKESAVAPR